MPVSVTLTCSLVLRVGARLLPDGDEDVAALGELERVADQVGQDLLDPRRVADDAGRHIRVDVANQLEPFLVRAQGERLERVRDRRAQRERHRFELEPPRFDLREVENVVEDRQQRVGRGPHRGQAVALIGRELAVEHQVGHADDAVHRRPDLVAHVGEKLALGAARLHRPVAGDDQFLVAGLQLRGARVDGLFEVVLLQQQLLIALLDVRQHRVELVDQLADLVVVARRGADVVAAAVADQTRHRDQPRDRVEDQARRRARQAERNPEAAEQRAGDDRREAREPGPDFVGVGLHLDAADDLVVQRNRPDDAQAAAARTRATGSTPGRRRRHRGAEPARIPGGM